MTTKSMTCLLALIA